MIINKIYLLILFFMLLVLQSFAYDNKESNNTINIPTGMELRKVGDVNVLVPKGSTIRTQGGVNIIESAEEYSAKKFLDTEKRLEKIESEQELLKKEIERLKTALVEFEKRQFPTVKETE